MVSVDSVLHGIAMDLNLLMFLAVLLLLAVAAAVRSQRRQPARHLAYRFGPGLEPRPARGWEPLPRTRPAPPARGRR